MSHARSALSLDAIQREPFRLFFPLGLAIAAAGVFPWLAFGRGWTYAWPGVPHALVMTQGFLLAMAVGFLGTMLPRRTRTAPASTGELALFAGALTVGPGALLAGATELGEGVLIVAFVTLARFAVRRFRARTTPLALPPSFVFIPLALLLGVAGAVCAVVGVAWAPHWLGLGRSLAAQGMLFALVLAVAPMLVPVIVHGRPPGPTRSWRIDALIALLFAVTFVGEEWLSGSLALLARGVLVAVALTLAGVWTPGTRPGLHRALFRLSLLLVPMGLVAAGLAPERRVSLLHLSYAGGLAILTLATTVHVTVSHTGRAWLADRRPWLVAISAVLLFGATIVRVGLDHAGPHYIDALVLAAALWLLGVIAWGAFIVPMLVRPAAKAEGAA